MNGSTEEGRDVVRADVVKVASDAERFGGLLPAALCRRADFVQPLADEYQRKSAQHSQPHQPTSHGADNFPKPHDFIPAVSVSRPPFHADPNSGGNRQTTSAAQVEDTRRDAGCPPPSARDGFWPRRKPAERHPRQAEAATRVKVFPS